MEQWQKLWNRIALLYDKSCKESDAIYCIMLSKAAFKKMQRLGAKPDNISILDEIDVLYLQYTTKSFVYGEPIKTAF